jgi:hypothetical protein
MLQISPAVDAQNGVEGAVEYCWSAKDHYIVTANAAEINVLDNGIFPVWVRTGEALLVQPPTAKPVIPSAPVCRFYRRPEAGLDSHFYSAFPAECQAVLDRFPNAWVLESSNVFQIAAPSQQDGSCPPATVPVYRLYNNRPDANHRYTTSLPIRGLMTAAGWIPEGYGRPGRGHVHAPLKLKVCSQVA